MGNRSAGPYARGVVQTSIRLPGATVSASICIPRAHAYAVWLLPWIEGLLRGMSLDELIAAPPWPLPSDALVVRRLVHTLFDLRWAMPVWTSEGVVVDPHLAEVYRTQGRMGLARELFDVEVISGEWWAEGLSGTILSRQTAMQFDWDHRRRADHVLPFPSNLQARVELREPDLEDLLRKLGGVQDVWISRERAFLGSPLIVGERKDILFTMVGEEPRLLPDELAELEPVLAEHVPELFGNRKKARSRVLQIPPNPVERIGHEVARLSTDPVCLGSIALVAERIEKLSEQVNRAANELARWLDEGIEGVPILGGSQRHFDLLGEICAWLPTEHESIVLISSSFLHVKNSLDEDGLASVMAEAPERCRFLLLYGHATDDLPEKQRADIAEWRSAVVQSFPTLADRLEIVAARRRSHEKVVISSLGDWMVGSWNAASSRPRSPVFECSLHGRAPEFAVRLLEHLRSNVEGQQAEEIVTRLAEYLRRATKTKEPRGRDAVVLLQRAVQLVKQALPEPDGTCAQAWAPAVRALRAAILPFLKITPAEIVDEQQTRDLMIALVNTARRDVLLASDRLTETAFDRAMLRDLRGSGRGRRTVRVVWGREWAGGAIHDKNAADQLARARRTIREAREMLGRDLLTQDQPMENHAKLLVVDGQRGLVTSENLLHYGGEKGRYETRELGILFQSPSIAKHLLGRILWQWPSALGDESAMGHASMTTAWAIAGNEAWHATNAIAHELDFNWQSPTFIGGVVRDELTRETDDEFETEARRRCLKTLEARAGKRPFEWIREEGERLGLIRPSANENWHPYDGDAFASRKALLREAEAALAALPKKESSSEKSAVTIVDSLLTRILDGMLEIPAGSFMMGDDRVDEERPRHKVIIQQPFLLGKTPVTQGLWQVVMGRLPHLRDVERHPEFPIIHVTYAEMQQFLRRLEQLAGKKGFELPPEAQWEYACRAGSNATYCFGNDPGQGERPGMLERYAWTKRNAGGRMQSVGKLLPNAFGLYDMHGLVYETMRDGFRKYAQATVSDPIGPLNAGRIVARGGSWGRFPVDPHRPVQEHFRCASRQVYEKSQRVSFRISCRIEGKP